MASERRIQSSRGASRLLLLDDDEALLEALTGTLQNKLAHLHVDACQTAQEAIGFLHDTSYDTIISDVNMPSMNGLEFVKKINEIRPHTPIILMSGNADNVLVSKAFEEGIADFIEKPIDRDRLLISMRQTLYFSRLRSLLKRQQDAISRAKQQYLAIIGELGQSTEEWAERLRALDNNVLIRSFDVQFRNEQKLHVFSKQSTQRLASLDAFILKTIQASNKTLAHLTAAQHNLRCLSNKTFPAKLNPHGLSFPS